MSLTFSSNSRHRKEKMIIWARCRIQNVVWNIWDGRTWGCYDDLWCHQSINCCWERSSKVFLLGQTCYKLMVPSTKVSNKSSVSLRTSVEEESFQEKRVLLMSFFITMIHHACMPSTTSLSLLVLCGSTGPVVHVINQRLGCLFSG